MSNLPPGVSVTDIPGNRPEDVVFDSWLEGDIGDALFELARRQAYGEDLEESIKETLRAM